MKLLIIGSRNIQKFNIEPYIKEDDIELIISGGAGGIDTIAEQYADKHRLSKLIIRPQYKLYHRSAPLKRNEKMIEICDRVLVIWDGKSRGTKYSIDYANKIGRLIKIILFNTTI